MYEARIVGWLAFGWLVVFVAVLLGTCMYEIRSWFAQRETRSLRPRGVSRALFIGHFGVSLAAKRIDARLSSVWIFLAFRQFPGIFRGDVRGSFLVGSKAEGSVHTSTLTGISDKPMMEKAT
jgi:hypothetical protein